jgi:hypothetical protein
MSLVIGGVYKTSLGNFLRLESIGGILYNFLLVDKNNVEIPEKKNRFGHVVVRNKVQYSQEIISSFKKVK